MTSLNGYGILFDMDGVIHDSEAIHFKAHAKNFEQIKSYIQNQRHKEISDGQTYKEPEFSFDEAYYAKYRLGTPTSKTVVDMFRGCGVEPNEREIEIFSNNKENNCIKIGEAEKFEGVKTVFQNLYEAGVKIAIVTSNTKPVTKKYLSKGIVFSKKGGKFSEITKYIDGYITKDDIKNGKPDPEPYNKGRALLGIEDPKKCIGVEDSPAGIESIQNGNMPAIGFPSFFAKHLVGKVTDIEIKKLEKEKFAYADAIIEDIQQITPELLTKIFSNYNKELDKEVAN